MPGPRAQAASPDDSDAVRVERFVGRDEGRALDRRLCDEQSVERVAVMPGELLDGRGVVEADREQLRTGAQERRREIAGRLELAERALDRDFPHAISRNATRSLP
jgi:hypothetical protein